jgi:nitroreductase/Pyruvate/2-oxoacid:ferredoxin oxidoreductase delta subunit
MKPLITPPVVDRSRCTGCGLCVRVCPSFVLGLVDGLATVAYGDWCNGCGHCGAVCPADAVSQKESSAAGPLPGSEPACGPDPLQLLFRERRSVRAYRQEPVPREVLARIIEAGRYAPTGTNSQNVRYTVLTAPARIDELRTRVFSFYEKLFSRVRSKAGAFALSLVVGRRVVDFMRDYLPRVDVARRAIEAGDDRLLYHAPAVILVHAEKWDPCSAFNCGAALYGASLMAHALGLGCCFNGFVEGAVNNDRRIKAWLEIPPKHRCYGAMGLGYPAVRYRKLVERRVPEVTWL